MTERLEIYKCNICGNVVQVLLNGIGNLVCCGESMVKMEANSDENQELAEKHIPTIEIEESKRFVRVGNHPMVPEHFIQFIEVYPKDKSRLYLKYLNPNEKAEFEITHLEENIEAFELCNVHGLWRKVND